MTTRAELLDAFEAGLDGWLLPAQGSGIIVPDLRSRIIEVVENIGGDVTIERHVCYYWDNDKANKGNESFFTINRGMPDEEAVWIHGRNPRPPIELTFAQEMLTWLRSRIDRSIGANTLRHIENITADNAIERGTADVILETGGGAFVRRSAAIWKNALAEWQFREIT